MNSELFRLFGAIGSWVAFGPGERDFGDPTSLGPPTLAMLPQEVWIDRPQPVLDLTSEVLH